MKNDKVTLNVDDIVNKITELTFEQLEIDRQYRGLSQIDMVSSIGNNLKMKSNIITGKIGAYRLILNSNYGKL